SDLIDHQRRRWNQRKMEILFIPSDSRILEKNQPAVSEQDSWIWKRTRNGVYSVNTGYELAVSEIKKDLVRGQIEKSSLNPLKVVVWDLKAPSKLKVFIWKAVSADVWLSAKEEMVRDEETESRPQCRREIGWVVPPRQFVKCNIGMKWSNKKKELGVAWILRNSEVWCPLSVKEPKAWPSFKSKVSELRHLLGELLEWSVMKETGDINRDAR
ncbi:unnamed protein product, partial [Brassica rapa]